MLEKTKGQFRETGKTEVTQDEEKNPKSLWWTPLYANKHK
jgi:hypothetical protein